MNPEVCKPTPFLVNPPGIFFFLEISKNCIRRWNARGWNAQTKHESCK